MARDREQFDSWVGQVYGATGAAEIEASYDAWAEDYDAAVEAVGYRLPAVAAGFVGRHLPRDAGEILDAGCGTGLLGEILHTLGYARLVGIDLSAGMLARAEARRAYGALHQMELGKPLGFADGRFAAVTALGVLTMGHAPPAALDELIRVTRPGGSLIFSVPEPAYKDGGFEARMAELDAAGRWQLIEATPPFKAIPGSQTEGDLIVWVFVYRAA